MNGLDLTAINEAVKQLFALFSVPIAFVGLGLTELVKKRFSNVPVVAVWIPEIGVLICVGLSFVFKVSVVVGIVTGVFITGGYSVLMNFIKNIGVGNGNGGNQPPAPPQA
jgi:hypothetical protein